MTWNPIGLWTIVKRELKRTFMIINQVVWPPIISTFLYITVFGLALGTRIHEVDGVPYLHFLLPGLIMMNVIDSAYGETSSSVFQGRFIASIQELLVAPLSAAEIVAGYVTGGVFRALIIGNLIMALAAALLGLSVAHPLLYLYFMVAVAALFSSLGLVMGVLAEKFDHLAILTTFFITPLVFVGGVFNSIAMFPPAFQVAARLNPLLYLIGGFRYAVTGHSDAGIALSLTVVTVMLSVALTAAYVMVERGHKLRS